MYAGEEDLVEVDVGEFVIPAGDAAQSLDASEVAFDRVAGAVGDAVQRPGLEAIRLRRRDQLPTERRGQRAQLIALVGAVGEQLRLTRYGAEPFQQPASPGRIAPVTRRQGQEQRQPVIQDECVQLGRQPPARATDRLAPLLSGAPIPS